MADIGRILILLGVALAITGAVFVLGGRIGLGHLPGDFAWRRGPVSFAFPLATSILVSVIFTLLLNLFLRRK